MATGRGFTYPRKFHLVKTIEELTTHLSINWSFLEAYINNNLPFLGEGEWTFNDTIEVTESEGTPFFKFVTTDGADTDDYWYWTVDNMDMELHFFDASAATDTTHLIVSDENLMTINDNVLISRPEDATFLKLQATDQADPNDSWYWTIDNADLELHFVDNSAGTDVARLIVNDSTDQTSLYTAGGVEMLRLNSDVNSYNLTLMSLVGGGSELIVGSEISNSSGIEFIDSSGAGRFGIRYDGPNNRLYISNRGSNGEVRITANTSTAGGGGEVEVIRVEDNQVTFFPTTLNIVYPSGMIYDFGSTTASAGVAFDSTADVLSTLTASVPNGIPVSIFVWGWFEWEFTLNLVEVSCWINVGGSEAGAKATIEQDLTTDTDATASSSSSTGSDGNHTHLLPASDETFSTHASSHTVGALTWATNSAGIHNHTMSHTHSHSHGLASHQQSIFYSGVRSFTPSGTTVAVDLIGDTGSSSQTATDRNLSYIVVVN